jgi:hypothetical protein
MVLDRRLIAGAVGLALFVAACGGSSTATSSPGASSAPASQAPASQAVESAEPESEAPTNSEEPEASGPDVSFSTGAAGDLEAMLPDEAGGTKFTKTSFDGADLGAAGIGMDTGELDPILGANGKTIADVRVAIASPTNPSATNTATVFAIQVRGLDASKLTDLVTGSDASSFTPATIAGKQVLKAGEGGFNSVIYVKDDILFDIILASDAATEAIVAALP